MVLYQAGHKMEDIQGKQFCDERGYLSFINDLDLSKYKRFYLVQNHKQGYIRAWHGHQYESKAIICIQGAAKIGLIRMITNVGKPGNKFWSPILEHDTLEFKTVSATNPQAIIIPTGYANGAMTLTDDCILMYLSDKTLTESKGDDYRFPFDRSLWEIKEY